MFHGSFNKLSPEIGCIQAWLNVVHIFSTLFGVNICLSFLQPLLQSRLLLLGQLTLDLLFHQLLRTNTIWHQSFFKSFSSKTWHDNRMLSGPTWTFMIHDVHLDCKNGLSCKKTIKQFSWLKKEILCYGQHLKGYEIICAFVFWF